MYRDSVSCGFLGGMTDTNCVQVQSQGQGGRPGAFSGRGRTLAGDAPPQDAPQMPQAPTQPPEQTVHTITFYTNGIFTVDDGTPKNSMIHGLAF